MYGVWGTLTLTGKLKPKVRNGFNSKAASSIGGSNWIEIHHDLDGFDSPTVPSQPSQIISIVTAHNPDVGNSSSYSSNGNAKLRTNSNGLGNDDDEFTALL